MITAHYFEATGTRGSALTVPLKITILKNHPRSRHKYRKVIHTELKVKNISLTRPNGRVGQPNNLY